MGDCDFFLHTEPEEDKPRNGDSVTALSTVGEDLVAIAVSDGVSSHRHDWFASSQACAVFADYFANGAQACDQRLADAGRAAHSHLQCLAGEFKGGLATMVAVAWRRGDDCAHLISVGDSRALRVAGTGVESLTTDDSVSRVPRLAGRVVLSAGAAATTHGLTRALGQEQPLEITARRIAFLPGDMLVLTSDGFHQLGGFAAFVRAAFHVADLEAWRSDRLLAEALAGATDDATVAILRRVDAPAALTSVWRAALRAEVDLGAALKDAAQVAPHLLARIIGREIAAAAVVANDCILRRAIDACSQLGLCPDPRTCRAALDAYVDAGGRDRPIANQLVAFVRAG